MTSKENQEALEYIKRKVGRLVYEEAKTKKYEGSKYYIDTEYFDTLQQAIDRLELVEKALDMACEKLENRKGCLLENNFEDDFEDCFKTLCKDCKYCINGKERWKEYLLQESEE